MLSECLARNITETEVTIQWRNPLHCGGRDDCYYLIKVNDGPPIRYTPTTIHFSSYTLDRLQPDTTYTITVSVHNGVSEQDADGAKSRECSVAVNTMYTRGSKFSDNNITVLETYISTMSCIDNNIILELRRHSNALCIDTQSDVEQCKGVGYAANVESTLTAIHMIVFILVRA